MYWLLAASSQERTSLVMALSYRSLAACRALRVSGESSALDRPSSLTSAAPYDHIRLRQDISASEFWASEMPTGLAPALPFAPKLIRSSQVSGALSSPAFLKTSER